VSTVPDADLPPTDDGVTLAVPVQSAVGIPSSCPQFFMLFQFGQVLASKLRGLAVQS